MTADVAEPQALDITRVIQETFSVLGRHFVTFVILALILVGLPSAVVRVFQVSALRSSVSAMSFSFGGPYMYWTFMAGLISLVTGAVLQAAIISGAAGDMNGRPVSVGESLRVGLRAFLPLIGLSILLGIGVGVGFLLLIVPGIFLALMWCVAVPAYVVEQPGVFESFSRSAALTEGNRLRILALGVLFLVAAIVIGIVLGIVGGILSIVSFGAFAYVNAGIVQPIISSVIAAFGATLSAVLYVELRRVKEGAGPQALAGVFD